MPDKKKHLELMGALLSVPMMVTVILVNLNNIKSQKANNAPAENAVTPIQVVISSPQEATNSQVIASTTKIVATTPTPTKTECKKEIGPVEILSPLDGEIITSDLINIDISTDSKYCPVTWSYRLGSDNWSDFSNKNISLYNLSPGKKQLQVKIKSAAGDKIVTLERNFIYKSSETVTITPTSSPTASPSATITQ